MSQMSLVMRYGYNNTILEDFIKFLDVHKEISTIDESKDEILETRLTGLNLGLIVIDCFKKLNLDSKYCIGLTTDGC